MKKSVLILATVCFAAVCLSACNLTGGKKKEDKTPGDQTVVQDEYDALNEMVGMEYSRIVLTVTDTFGEDLTLTSVYEIGYSGDCVTIDYTVERFTGFDGTEDVLPDPVTTLTGRTVILDGEIFSVTGDDVGITPSAATLGFTFKEEYFENADLNEVYLKADVKDPSAFLGTQISCSGMKLTVTFFDALNDINLSYVSENGNSVSLRYVFYPVETDASGS